MRKGDSAVRIDIERRAENDQGPRPAAVSPGRAGSPARVTVGIWVPMPDGYFFSIMPFFTPLWMPHNSPPSFCFV